MSASGFTSLHQGQAEPPLWLFARRRGALKVLKDGRVALTGVARTIVWERHISKSLKCLPIEGALRLAYVLEQLSDTKILASCPLHGERNMEGEQRTTAAGATVFFIPKTDYLLVYHVDLPKNGPDEGGSKKVIPSGPCNDFFDSTNLAFLRGGVDFQATVVDLFARVAAYACDPKMLHSGLAREDFLLLPRVLSYLLDGSVAAKSFENIHVLAPAGSVSLTCIEASSNAPDRFTVRSAPRPYNTSVGGMAGLLACGTSQSDWLATSRIDFDICSSVDGAFVVRIRTAAGDRPFAQPPQQNVSPVAFSFIEPIFPVRIPSWIRIESREGELSILGTVSALVRHVFQ